MTLERLSPKQKFCQFYLLATLVTQLSFPESSFIQNMSLADPGEGGDCCSGGHGGLKPAPGLALVSEAAL